MPAEVDVTVELKTQKNPGAALHGEQDVGSDADRYSPALHLASHRASKPALVTLESEMNFTCKKPVEDL